MSEHEEVTEFLRAANPNRWPNTADELRAVESVLADVYEPEGVRIWLRAKQVRFGGRTALEMIGAGHGDQVLAAAKSLT